ncbi:MAG: hypothetical protein Q4C61_09700 [Lachnospiraceae bacterium]|nr:hypothetical protein [Lachnospiraceae bacterium]
MNELQKIYELWSTEQSDNSSIKNAWCEIMQYLHENCSETIREEIATFILDFGKLTEQQAFTAGFQQAFILWAQIISSEI